ncbi:unnamed protein product [Cunninghamella echinulata]
MLSILLTLLLPVLLTPIAKDFFKEDMPTYDDFNEQVKDFINCDQTIHTDPLTINWKEVSNFLLAINVIRNLMKVYRRPKEEPTVCSFSLYLLRLFLYDREENTITINKEFSLTPSVSKKLKKMEVMCNIYLENFDKDHITLIQESRCLFYSHFKYCPNDEDKKYCYPEEIQFMNDALKAFQDNDRIYRYNMKSNSHFLTFQWIPGVIMIGTRPRFLLMPITHDLLQAVIDGQPPVKETIIKEYIIPSPTPFFTGSEMKFRDQRLHTAACYKAFKKFVVYEPFFDKFSKKY